MPRHPAARLTGRSAIGLVTGLATALVAAGLVIAQPAGAVSGPVPLLPATGPTVEVVADIASYATGLTWDDGRVDTITSAAVDAADQTILSVDATGGGADVSTPIPEPPAFTATDLVAAPDGSFYFNGYDLPPGAVEARYGLSRLSADGSHTAPATRSALPYREAHGLALSEDGQRLYVAGFHDLPQTTDGYVGRLSVGQLDDQGTPETLVGGVQTSDDCHPSFTATLACMSEPSAFAFVGGQVWVADNLAGVVSVLDRASGAVLHRYGLGATPAADGVPIADAAFDTVGPLAGDADGNAYVTVGSGGETRLYKVTGDGVLHRVAGGGPSPDATTTTDPDQLGLRASRLAVDPTTGDVLALHQVSTNHFQIVRFAGTAELGIDPPGAPTGLSTAYGFESVRVSFDPPADDGGDPIVDYQVTARPVGSVDPADVVNAFGESSPIVVAGIDEGDWEFTVRAENAQGFGDPSATVVETVRHVEVVLDVSPTSGTAPFFATLDASGSSLPPGAALQFHCGDTFAPPQVAGDGLSAECKYNRASPSGGFRARATMADPVAGITLSDQAFVTVAGPFVPSADLRASVRSGTAPLTVDLDASDSSAPAGATFEFHCGDSHDVDQAASDDRTATCRYERRSPEDGWNAFVRMHDPATGRNYEASVPITVAPRPDTVDDSGAFDADRPVVEVPVAADGSLTSDTCGATRTGVRCVTIDGVTVILAAAPGTFAPGTKVQVYAGDTEALRAELGSDVVVQGGFAVTWTPRVELDLPLVVTIPNRAAGERIADRHQVARAFTGFDLGGFLGSVGSAIGSGVSTVVGTVGSAVSSVGNAISSLWSAPAHRLSRPNGSSVNNMLTCAEVTAEGDDIHCQGPYLLQRDVATSVLSTLDAGSYVIASGGANVIASGGGNVIASGGGNVIAAGGGNLTVDGATVIAAGGGNVIASGGGNVIAAGGGNVIASGGGNVIASGGANVIAAGGGNLSMTLVRDPGFAAAQPADPTPPTIATTLSPPLPASGFYPPGTEVTVTATATSPASPAIPLRNVNLRVDGTDATPYTLVPGNTAGVKLSRTGTSTVTFGAQDADLNEAAPRSVTVRIGEAPAPPAPVGRKPQTLTFPAPTGAVYGDDVAPVATATSGLPVALSSGTPDVCRVQGGVARMIGVGTCRLVAAQGGSTAYLPAASVTRDIAVGKAPLTVRAASVVMVRHGRRPAVAATYAGFRLGDDVLDLDRAARCTVRKRRTVCGKARSAHYRVSYRKGKVRFAKGHHAFLSPGWVYWQAGDRATLKVRLDGPGHPRIKLRGKLPKGVHARWKRHHTRLVLTGRPHGTAVRTLRLTAVRHHHTVARQRLTVVVLR